MDKKITTLTCLSAMAVAGNAYAGGHHEGGGGHPPSTSHPGAHFSHPSGGPIFRPIHNPGNHGMRPSPIRHMEGSRMRPISHGEPRGFQSMRPPSEHHESRIIRNREQRSEFRSFGQRNDFRGGERGDFRRSERPERFGRGEHQAHFRGGERHMTKARPDYPRNRMERPDQEWHHRNERHERQDRHNWEQHGRHQNTCHSSHGCSNGHKPHERNHDGHHHGKHYYQFVPTAPNPHWGTGGSHHEWYVLDRGVQYMPPPPKLVQAPPPKAKPRKPQLVRSAPVRPKYQKVAQAAPTNLCNLRYKYPTINNRKGGFYQAPTQTCAQTVTVCIKVNCNNPRISYMTS